MAAATTIAAIVSAIAAVGGATVAGVQARQQQTEGKRARSRQQQAQAKAESAAATQQRDQQRELSRQNQEEPDLAALIASAEQPGGAASTFLTGQTGTAGADGQIGRNTLLGQ